MSDNQVARFVEQLRVSQWASPQQLAGLQHSLTERLVRHALAETEAYPERLTAIRGDDGTLDLSRWEEIPILTRPELQARQAAFVARTVPEMTGTVIDYTTSGSTGRPMDFVKSALLTRASAAVVERAHDWADVDRDQTYATIGIGKAPLPEGRIKTGWSFLGGTAEHGFLPIEAPLSMQIDFLTRLKPVYLRTFPTNAAALAEAAAGLDWHRNLKHVFCFGETLTERHVETIARHLGVGVTDFYASEESGQMATRCPHSGQYHVSAETVFMEVVREDGTPSQPGEIGRMIVTPFYNYAMPLIRYDQGDYAELPDKPCGCGRTLPTLKRIMGRNRDMFVLPNGDRVWPRLIQSEILKLMPVAQWQVVQHTRELIEIRYVADGSGRPTDVAGLEAYVAQRYGPTVRLQLTELEHIARTPGGKYREFISHVT